MKSEFDGFAKSYDESLKNALKTVNIDASYFTEYKVKELYNYYKKTSVSPKKILDFGCGVGNSSYFLSQYFPGAEIYGVDISKESIQLAQKREIKNTIFDIYDGENLLFEKESFDAVFISNVFHHIDHDKHIALLEQIRLILKKEGILFFFEHNTLNPVTQKIVNDCIFDKDARLLNFLYTKKIFKEVGFQNKVNFILFIPPKFKKLLFLEKYLRWLPFGGQYLTIAKKEDRRKNNVQK